MIMLLLVLTSCAPHKAEVAEEWYQANIRRQEIIFMTEPDLLNGWFATQVPLAMAEDLIGRDVLVSCLSGVGDDGSCTVQLHDCMEVSVPKTWPDGVEPYVMVGFRIDACPELMRGPNTQWTQHMQDGAQATAWIPPGAPPATITAPVDPPAPP